jgi:hypothetical protein
MQDLRTTIGVALAMSMALILLAGFLVTSSREFVFIFLGFAAGVLSVFLIEHLKVSRRARQNTIRHA